VAEYSTTFSDSADDVNCTVPAYISRVAKLTTWLGRFGSPCCFYSSAVRLENNID